MRMPVRPMRARLDGLLSTAPRGRLATVLEVLCTLADENAQALASPSAFGKEREGAPSGHEPERVNRVLALIDARFAQRLTLSELADAANLSERRLNRYFIQHLGESVGRYLNRVRIGHAAACWPIRHGRLPLSRRAPVFLAWPIPIVRSKPLQTRRRMLTGANSRTANARRLPMRRYWNRILEQRSPSLDRKRFRKQ